MVRLLDRAGGEPEFSLDEFISKGLEVLLYPEVGTQEKCSNILKRLKPKLYWQTLQAKLSDC